MRRQVVISWPRKIVPGGGVYDEDVENQFEDVQVSSVVIDAPFDNFKDDIDLVIGERTHRLAVTKGNGTWQADVWDIPYAELVVKKGAAVRLRAVSASLLDAGFVAAFVGWMDDGRPEGNLRHGQYESLPLVVAPGATGTMVVAPAERSPFKINLVHLARGRRLVVKRLAVHNVEQLVLPEVPGEMFERTGHLDLDVVPTMAMVTMEVENRGKEPVRTSLKLEGVNVVALTVAESRALLKRVNAMAKYGKFAQSPARAASETAAESRELLFGSGLEKLKASAPADLRSRRLGDKELLPGHPGDKYPWGPADDQDDDDEEADDE